MLSDTVYIDSEQLEQLTTMLQTLIDKQNDIQKICATTLITLITFLVIWIWSKFLYHVLVEPVGDD